MKRSYLVLLFQAKRHDCRPVGTHSFSSQSHPRDHRKYAQHFRPVGSRKSLFAPNRQKRAGQSVWRSRLRRKAKLYRRIRKNRRNFK